MNHNKKHGVFHGLLMLICCLAPILLLVLFAPQLRNLAGGGSNLYWLILLLCPLMHIGMMFFMKDKGGSCHGRGSETKKLEESNNLQNEQ
ncbi:MAG: hypothetical protein VR72_18310 [Clostridiaceae bacterium BRH_c20a]|nr:MAG: hypothetical protein VR72_18310 [Clostridiaceae bacterium BRH_c20a]